VIIPSSADLVKVLVIDSDKNSIDLITSHLVNSGYDVLQSRDVNKSLQAISDFKPELILCDLRMPLLNGVNILKLITDGYPNLPVIVISTDKDMSDAVEALRLGASDYLVKPINDLEVLEHSIEKSLERYSLRRENISYRNQLEQANRELKSNLAVLEQDHQAGLEVQKKMLPISPMQKSCYLFQHCIIPSVYLSGDFVEYINVANDFVVFFIADVSGHGASSAFVTVLMKNLTVRMRSQYNRQNNDDILNPTKFLDQANAELLGTAIGKHVTLFIAVLDCQKNSLKYSVAGALPLPILISENTSKYLVGDGPPIGLFEDALFSEYELDLPKKFRLLMLSDGILEVLNNKTLSEKESNLLELAPALLGEMDLIFEELNVNKQNQYPDDIALFVIDKI